MALIRVAQYNSTPTVVEDYQAQNAHLQAFTNQLMTQQFILDSGTDQPVIKQGCYVSHGGSLYVADADTAITGSPSDGSVYIRVSGTTSLTVEFITDISGYTWNPVYSALTSGGYTLLPYLIVKASTVWTRYNFNPNNQSFGAIKATSIDTGYGAISGSTIDATNKLIANKFEFSKSLVASDTVKFSSKSTHTTTSKIPQLAVSIAINNILTNPSTVRIKMGFTRENVSYHGIVTLKLNDTTVYSTTVGTSADLVYDLTLESEAYNFIELYYNVPVASTGTFTNTYLDVCYTGSLSYLEEVLMDVVVTG